MLLSSCFQSAQEFEQGQKVKRLELLQVNTEQHFWEWEKEEKEKKFFSTNPVCS